MLDHCVSNETHTGKAAAIPQFLSGALHYRCQHTTCHGKHCKEVREKCEPGYQERRTDRQLVQQFTGRRMRLLRRINRPKCQPRRSF